MRPFFAYTRVSTVKQGERGVSLHEQKDAITRYAQHSSLAIAEWFEERESAAKRGRPVFARMMKQLQQGNASGVIIHKIDRSARNLRDWADLGEMIDQGIEVHFVNESLDLHSRGGRLSADIQAVIAADFIRNLREETRKGFYGRLKQGLYPLGAPLGYLDKGGGNPKEIDPIKGPLVRRAFELYATAKYGFYTLQDELWRMGLRNKRGHKISLSGLTSILNNQFYIGLMKIERTGEMFTGMHPPLISKTLFDRVHQVLTGKTNARAVRYEFLLRRLLRCRQCGYGLIGERQKGRIYYRCHTSKCRGTCVREDRAEKKLSDPLFALRRTEAEQAYILDYIAKRHEDWRSTQAAQISAITLRQGEIRERLNRLTDALVDGVIDKQAFEQRKSALLMEQKELEENMSLIKDDERSLPTRVNDFLELSLSLYLNYFSGFGEQKRQILKLATSNREVEGKYLDFKILFPFNLVANREKITCYSLERDVPRTVWEPVLAQLFQYFEEYPTAFLEEIRAMKNNSPAGIGK